MIKETVYFIVNSEGYIVRASFEEEVIEQKLKALPNRFKMEVVDIDFYEDNKEEQLSTYLNRLIEPVKNG